MSDEAEDVEMKVALAMAALMDAEVELEASAGKVLTAGAHLRNGDDKPERDVRVAWIRSEHLTGLRGRVFLSSGLYNASVFAFYFSAPLPTKLPHARPFLAERAAAVPPLPVYAAASDDQCGRTHVPVGKHRPATRAGIRAPTISFAPKARQEWNGAAPADGRSVMRGMKSEIGPQTAVPGALAHG
ncbi:hypothetical protein MTO96_026394 [Rhipicephalus appendiculatus]